MSYGSSLGPNILIRTITAPTMHSPAETMHASPSTELSKNAGKVIRLNKQAKATSIRAFGRNDSSMLWFTYSFNRIPW